MNKPKIVLAYSGGLDTSVAIKWLQEKYNYDVIALALDLGEGKDLDFIRQKALSIGAIKSIVVDVKKIFAEEFLLPALQANALYEGIYPLSAALSRPLIAKFLVYIAEQEGAEAVAHGCTGKGNDQVRFDISVKILNPKLKIVAPVREHAMSRTEGIAYAKLHNIPLPVDLDNPFSLDVNLWGRSCECGVLEDPWQAPPEAAFGWTNAVENTPDIPEEIIIEFSKGKPVALNQQPMDFVEIIEALNQLAGKHGIGRIDHIENRLIGIKSREVYEAPAAMTLIKAHQALEAITLPKQILHIKPTLENEFAKLIYEAQWFSPLKEALEAFNAVTQKVVTGIVRLKLFKGQATVVGRKSSHSLYDLKLATYSEDDAFDHNAALGFIKLWGLPLELFSKVNAKAEALELIEG